MPEGEACPRKTHVVLRHTNGCTDVTKFGRCLGRLSLTSMHCVPTEHRQFGGFRTYANVAPAVAGAMNKGTYNFPAPLVDGGVHAIYLMSLLTSLEGFTHYRMSVEVVVIYTPKSKSSLDHKFARSTWAKYDHSGRCVEFDIFYTFERRSKSLAALGA